MDNNDDNAMMPRSSREGVKVKTGAVVATMKTTENMGAGNNQQNAATAAAAAAAKKVVVAAAIVTAWQQRR
jgi:hypothetical protein